MQNRTRNKQIILRFTEDEAEYFKNYKAKSQIAAYSDFVLHLLTHSQLFVIDTKPLLKVAEEINKMSRYLGVQFIIATHSPFMLGILDAKIYNLDTEDYKVQKWSELENVRYFYEFFKNRKNEFEK